MTQEEKDLLLRDLCSRLPYGVIVEYEGNLSKLDTIFMCDSISISSTSIDKNLSYNLSLDEFKPYLYPMSTMSKEQKKEYAHILVMCSNLANCQLSGMTVEDWLNKNHFDYRGLIPMGLAIDATGLNIY